MPPGQSVAENAISTRVSIDRLVLGSIPDIGFAGDIGLHGPKRYNWHQLVGSLNTPCGGSRNGSSGKGPGYRKSR